MTLPALDGTSITADVVALERSGDDLHARVWVADAPFELEVDNDPATQIARGSVVSDDGTRYEYSFGAAQPGVTFTLIDELGTRQIAGDPASLALGRLADPTAGALLQALWLGAFDDDDEQDPNLANAYACVIYHWNGGCYLRCAFLCDASDAGGCIDYRLDCYTQSR